MHTPLKVTGNVIPSTPEAIKASRILRGMARLAAPIPDNPECFVHMLPGPGRIGHSSVLLTCYQRTMRDGRFRWYCWFPGAGIVLCTEPDWTARRLARRWADPKTPRTLNPENFIPMLDIIVSET